MRVFTIRIPTTPYFKKFITKYHGHPIRINNNTPIGVVVITLLQNKKHINYKEKNKDTRFITFNDHIIATLPMDAIKYWGCNLSEDAVIQLNRYYEAFFEESLYFYVQRNIRPDGRYKGYNEAIQKFADYFGITDDDISMEGLKKMEYRYRKNIEKRNLENSRSLFGGSDLVK